jgi:hypothetical protein
MDRVIADLIERFGRLDARTRLYGGRGGVFRRVQEAPQAEQPS